MICLQYRRWISGLGCCIESCPRGGRRCDPCHTGSRGLSQKTSDLSCIPLCRFHHNQFDANPRAFAEFHGINIPELVASLNEVGLAGIQIHRPARRSIVGDFTRMRCICGWKSFPFRLLEDAQGSLHSHIQDQIEKEVA